MTLHVVVVGAIVGGYAHSADSRPREGAGRYRARLGITLPASDVQEPVVVLELLALS